MKALATLALLAGCSVSSSQHKYPVEDPDYLELSRTEPHLVLSSGVCDGFSLFAGGTLYQLGLSTSGCSYSRLSVEPTIFETLQMRFTAAHERAEAPCTEPPGPWSIRLIEPLGPSRSLCAPGGSQDWPLSAQLVGIVRNAAAGEE